MDGNGFREVISQRFEPGFVATYGPLVLAENLQKSCMELAFDHDPRIAFRASYALEYAFFDNPEKFTGEYGGMFLECMTRTTNPSVHRHYTKILAFMLEKNIIRLSDRQVEEMTEFVFDLLISPRTKPAVRATSMNILYELCDRLDWIAGSLYDTILHISADSTPAVRNRGEKICKRLKKYRP